MPYYFRLPPITDLTVEQQAVLNETRAIAVFGGPGTGKSVVSLWRHIRNHDTERRNSLLLTYTKSLERYLMSSGRNNNEDAADNVDRTYNWINNGATEIYDEIIVDEAQDVNQSVYERMSEYTEMISFSADDNQILYPNHSSTQQQLISLFPNPNFTLRANYRNTKEVVRFVRSLFPNSLISDGRDNGPKPQLICTDGINENQTQIIRDVIENFASPTHNIAVLVPLVNHVNFWYNDLINSGFECSKYVNEDEALGIIENIHITTYKSCKGLEFDTVIVPNFNRFESFIQLLNVVERNDYYVVFTRSRRNLILIDHQPIENGSSSIPFIQNQIRNNIVEVDLSYVSNDNRNNNIEYDYDDLPF